MGLDTTHGCYSGGYGGFKFLREQLALAAGYKLLDHPSIGKIPDLDWESYPEEAAYGDSYCFVGAFRL